MPPKAFQVFEDARKAVRPYPRSKQARSTNTQTKKRIPLQETPNRINESRKRGNKKPEPKRNHQLVATKIPRIDEYSLENLRAIFEDEEKAEEKLEFKATSTPFDSQLVNSQIQEEHINNQRQLDIEINKIHDSINKESIISLIEELSPQINSKNKSSKNSTGSKRQKKQTRHKKPSQDIDIEKKPKPSKSKCPEHPELNITKPKKRMKKAETIRDPNKESLPAVNTRDQLHENSKQKVNTPKSRPVSKRKTRSESKSKGNLHQTQKVPPNPKPKLNPKVATKGTRPSKVRFKNELTYKQLLLKCAKGKDPIDLLM